MKRTRPSPPELGRFVSVWNLMRPNSSHHTSDPGSVCIYPADGKTYDFTVIRLNIPFRDEIISIRLRLDPKVLSDNKVRICCAGNYPDSPESCSFWQDFCPFRYLSEVNFTFLTEHEILLFLSLPLHNAERIR